MQKPQDPCGFLHALTFCTFEIVNNAKPFILFVAGEDSGDILGAPAVRAAVEMGFDAVGIGGKRMGQLGLCALESFENFPVSGFFDVLPRALFFKRIQKRLFHELSKKDCLGLCAVDYPGLNMVLCKAAKKMGKPVLYLEPPQIFAWKENRAEQLRHCNLAVFFPFEQEAYAKHGVETALVKHPFVDAAECMALQGTLSKKILLLPGSRKGTLKRNMPLYSSVAKKLVKKNLEPEFIVARDELISITNQYSNSIPCSISPESETARVELFNSAKCIVAPPGTSLFEATVSGTSAVAAIKPDFLTYILGKFFLKTEYLALPNLLLKRKEFQEIVVTPFESLEKVSQKIVEAILNAEKNTVSTEILAGCNNSSRTIYQLSLEFFGKLLAG